MQLCIHAVLRRSEKEGGDKMNTNDLKCYIKILQRVMKRYKCTMI